MSYGKKCNIIFIRKVRNRLEQFEEEYKDLSPKIRAAEINKRLLHDFCVLVTLNVFFGRLRQPVVLLS